MDEKKYWLLCELCTHPVPEIKLQNFYPHGLNTVGGFYQEAGCVIVLNEIAALESVIVALTALLCNVPRGVRSLVKDQCLDCVESAGGVNLDVYPDLWNKLVGSATLS